MQSASCARTSATTTAAPIAGCTHKRRSGHAGCRRYGRHQRAPWSACRLSADYTTNTPSLPERLTTLSPRSPGLSVGYTPWPSTWPSPRHSRNFASGLRGFPLGRRWPCESLSAATPATTDRISAATHSARNYCGLQASSSGTSVLRMTTGQMARSPVGRASADC